MRWGSPQRQRTVPWSRLPTARQLWLFTPTSQTILVPSRRSSSWCAPQNISKCPKISQNVPKRPKISQGEAYELLQDPRAQAELLALCTSNTARKRGGAKGPTRTQRQADTAAQRDRDRHDDGPHTTVYFRSARKEQEAARAAASERKRQRDERKTAVHRAEVEARMQSESWGSSVKSWQSWTGNTSAKRHRSHDEPGRASSVSASDGNASQASRRHVCMLCQRQFRERAALQRHEQHSQLHQDNLRKQAQSQHLHHQQASNANS